MARADFYVYRYGSYGELTFIKPSFIKNVATFSHLRGWGCVVALGLLEVTLLLPLIHRQLFHHTL